MPSKRESLESIIAARAGGIESQRLAWQAALQRLHSLHASGNMLEILARELRYASSAVAFAKALALDESDPAAQWDQFIALVDESAYDVRSWIHSVENILLRLQSEGRQAKLSSIVDYVACAAEFAQTRPEKFGLPELVSEMLERHGFEDGG